MPCSHWPKHWLHDRPSFFKYTTPETAKKILNRGTLRWSSPDVFNDPFDMCFDLLDPDDYANIRQLTLDALWKAHYSPEGGDARNILGHLIKAIRPIFPQLTREEFDEEFSSALDESLQKLPLSVSALNFELQRQMTNTKVLCLSERPDSILMWSHYADQHKGVVFEIACTPEVDSAWGAAMPVIYSDMPRMFDDDFLIRLGSGQASMEAGVLVNKFVTAKARDWAYEREWRVVLHFTDPNQRTQDIRFRPEELSAVYLGCQMTREDRADIVAKLGQSYPQTNIFVAEKATREFSLKFRPWPNVSS